MPLAPRLPREGVRLRQVRAAASWGGSLPREQQPGRSRGPGDPAGGAPAGRWGLAEGPGDWVRSWEMGGRGGGVLNATDRGGLREEGGALCGVPGLKSRRERERGGFSASSPLGVGSAFGYWGNEVERAPTSSMAPCGKGATGLALRPLADRGGGAESGRSLAAAEPAPPAAASSGWNEGNPRAEGSCLPPPTPHPEPRRRIPGMPAGAPTAAARRRKEGASSLPGRPEGRPQPGSRPPPAPPHWTEAPAPGRGREAGNRGCERHSDQGCSSWSFLRSQRRLTVLPSMLPSQAFRSVLLPHSIGGETESGQVNDLFKIPGLVKGGVGLEPATPALTASAGLP